MTKLMVPRMWSPNCYTSGKRLADTTPPGASSTHPYFPLLAARASPLRAPRLDEHQTIFAGGFLGRVLLDDKKIPRPSLLVVER